MLTLPAGRFLCEVSSWYSCAVQNVHTKSVSVIQSYFLATFQSHVTVVPSLSSSVVPQTFPIVVCAPEVTSCMNTTTQLVTGQSTFVGRQAWLHIWVAKDMQLV